MFWYYEYYKFLKVKLGLVFNFKEVKFFFLNFIVVVNVIIFVLFLYNLRGGIIILILGEILVVKCFWSFWLVVILLVMIKVFIGCFNKVFWVLVNKIFKIVVWKEVYKFLRINVLFFCFVLWCKLINVDFNLEKENLRWFFLIIVLGKW